jgi:putative transposase
VTVTGLCRQAGFSRQSFYKERRARSKAEIREGIVLDCVRRHRRIHPRIGVRKLHVLIRDELALWGISIGRDRLFALLRKHGLLVGRRRGRPQTTSSGHGMRVYGNLVRHIEPSMPGQVWVSDLTYLSTSAGFVYLSLITDAYSRQIVGYEVSDTLEAAGCLRSLHMALRGLPDGVRPIHHSDRGTQYCSRHYVDLLRTHGLAISMTEDNHCYENALAERVNGILKDEYGLGDVFGDKSQARQAAHEAIGIYNELRPHMALGYRTPAEAHAEMAA